MSWLLSRDPSMGVLLTAAWSLLVGMSLLLPGDAFRLAPAYAAMREIGWPEEVWGALAVAVGCALLVTLARTDLILRGAAAVAAWVFWLVFGCLLLKGGAIAGVFPAAGGFSIAAAGACFLAIAQWQRAA